MSDDPPFDGYAPRLEMPVVMPPPASFTGTAADYYAQAPMYVDLAASGSNGDSALITLTRAAGTGEPLEATLYAMTGGSVTFYPANATVPSPAGAFTAPATSGVLALKVFPVDVVNQKLEFPSDTPAIGFVYYVGADPAKCHDALRIATTQMKDPELRISWLSGQGSLPDTSWTREDLIDQHVGRVMLGSADVFVTAGTPIGAAAAVPSASVETYQFTLSTINSDPPLHYISPVPLFRGAPFYDL